MWVGIAWGIGTWRLSNIPITDLSDDDKSYLQRTATAQIVLVVPYATQLAE